MNQLPIGPSLPVHRERPRLPCALLSLSTSQGVNNGVTATVALDTTVYDTDGFSDLANNRFLVKPNSVYLVGGSLKVDLMPWTLVLEMDHGDGGGYVARSTVQPVAAALSTLVAFQGPTFAATLALIRLRATNNSGGLAHVTEAFLWCSQIA